MKAINKSIIGDFHRFTTYSEGRGGGRIDWDKQTNKRFRKFPYCLDVKADPAKRKFRPEIQSKSDLSPFFLLLYPLLASRASAARPWKQESGRSDVQTIKSCIIQTDVAPLWLLKPPRACLCLSVMATIMTSQRFGFLVANEKINIVSPGVALCQRHLLAAQDSFHQRLSECVVV